MMHTDKTLIGWVGQTSVAIAGEVQWQLCIKICMVYFRQDIENSRRAVVECLQRYLELAGPYMNYWACHGKRMKRYDNDVLLMLSKEYASKDKMEGMQFYIHSGRKKEDLAGFYISALDSPSWELNMGKERGTSRIEMVFPLGFFAASGQSLPDFVNFCAVRIKPYWGYAGIGLSKPFELMKRLCSEPVDIWWLGHCPNLKCKTLP